MNSLMHMALIESKRGMFVAASPLPDIPEEVKLADALMGRVRIRAHDKRVRYAVKAEMLKSGVPFSTEGTLAFDVVRGRIVWFRLREDIVECVWTPFDDDKFGASIQSMALFCWPGERLE